VTEHQTKTYVEHDDGALALDVVAVAETAESLLPSRVPDVELYGAPVRVEHQGVHLDAQRRHVLLLELTRQMPLHEGRLAHAAIADENQLELRTLHFRLRTLLARPSLRSHTTLLQHTSRFSDFFLFAKRRQDQIVDSFREQASKLS